MLAIGELTWLKKNISIGDGNSLFIYLLCSTFEENLIFSFSQGSNPHSVTLGELSVLSINY